MQGSEPRLDIYYNRLPHWRLEGSAYFITWRVQPKQASLSEPERDIVAAAIKYFHPERYRLLAYVVMDDHAHVVLIPAAGRKLSGITHSIKSYTANLINMQRGEHGELWQKACFDRIIRDEAELLEKMQYVINNPAKRWPGTSAYQWAEWLDMP